MGFDYLESANHCPIGSPEPPPGDLPCRSRPIECPPAYQNLTEQSEKWKIHVLSPSSLAPAELDPRSSRRGWQVVLIRSPFGTPSCPKFNRYSYIHAQQLARQVSPFSASPGSPGPPPAYRPSIPADR